jgi:hypothetical protein
MKKFRNCVMRDAGIWCAMTDKKQTDSEACAERLVLLYGMPINSRILREMLALAFCEGAMFAGNRAREIVQEQFGKS